MVGFKNQEHPTKIKNINQNNHARETQHFPDKLTNLAIIKPKERERERERER